jgi:hypothetical protein
MPDEPTWKDDLPEELKDNPTLQDVPDVATLAKRFVDTKSMVGRSVRIPGEDASQEDWDKFNQTLTEKVPGLMVKPDTTDDTVMSTLYDQLGRPEDADKYELPEIDSQGIELDMSLADNFKGIAHKYGLNQKQFKGIVEELTGVSVEKALDARAKADLDAKALVDDWGLAYEKNVKLAIAAAERTDAPLPMQEMLKKGSAPSDLYKYFHYIATTIGDGEGNPLVADAGTGGIVTPNEAKLQMSEMRRNSNHPLNHPSDPGHQAALEKYKKLAEAAFPEAQ